MTLPKERCFVCTHLLVGMPNELSSGGKMKKTRSEAFSCHDDPICPAQQVRIAYDPFTKSIIERAVTALYEGGEIAPLNDLYAQADGVSVEIHDKFHITVRGCIAKQVAAKAG